MASSTEGSASWRWRVLFSGAVAAAFLALGTITELPVARVFFLLAAVVYASVAVVQHRRHVRHPRRGSGHQPPTAS